MKEVPVGRDREEHSELDWKEQTAYRSLQGAQGWTANRSRPDASFDVSIAGSKNREAQVKDLKEMNKTVKYLKSTNTVQILFPRMQGFGDDLTLKLRWLALCDAALHNREEGRSQGARSIRS